MSEAQRVCPLGWWETAAVLSAHGQWAVGEINYCVNIAIAVSVSSKHSGACEVVRLDDGVLQLRLSFTAAILGRILTRGLDMLVNAGKWQPSTPAQSQAE